MRMPAADQKEVAELLQRSVAGLLLCAAFGVAFLVKGGVALITGGGALLLSGVFFAGLVVYSWRHYHPYWSWLIWAVPGPALVISAFQLFIVPSHLTGEISVVVGLLGLFGCAGLGYFGALFTLRGYVWRSLNSDGT